MDMEYIMIEITILFIKVNINMIIGLATGLAIMLMGQNMKDYGNIIKERVWGFIMMLII